MYAHQSVALIAQSPVMRAIIDRIRVMESSDSSVLLIGETVSGRS